MAPPAGNGLLVIERILRDREGVWQQIIDERDLRGLTGQMLASSAVSLACYGAVLGASNGWAQALSSAAKLPLLFLATLTICLPTLYLFNLVFGARLSMMQALTVILVSITVISVLTLAFAPISLFFLISAHNYSFYKLLNVCILVLTAVVGLRFLISGMRALNEHQARLAEMTGRPARGRPVPSRPRRRWRTRRPTVAAASRRARWLPRAAGWRWPCAPRRRYPHPPGRCRSSAPTACPCCTSGSCCSASSAPSSAGRCARSSAARASRSRSSGTSRARSTPTS